jgi:hypothetical protein
MHLHETSDRFNAAIVGSHRIATMVELYMADTLVATYKDDDPYNYVTGGFITMDRAATPRRSGYITLTDASPSGVLVPSGLSTDQLNVLGAEFRPYRGITFPDGTKEYVPLGVFLITNLEVAESGNGMYMKAQGYDRSRRVKRGGFVDVFAVAAGTNYVTAIQQILSQAYPQIQYGNVASTTYTTPLLVYTPGKDPWAAATDMATAIGYELYFDPHGQCNIMPPRDLSSVSTPDFFYTEGANATFMSEQIYYDADEKPNWIIVTGEAPGNVPIKAEAKDTNTASPTYIYGPYGKNVKAITASDINSLAVAQARANNELALALGGAQMVYLTTVPNPAMDIDTLCRLTRAKAKLNGDFVMEQMTIPMSAEAAASVGLRQVIR